jgi:hypothetical protein
VPLDGSAHLRLKRSSYSRGHPPKYFWQQKGGEIKKNSTWRVAGAGAVFKSV